MDNLEAISDAIQTVEGSGGVAVERTNEGGILKRITRRFVIREKVETTYTRRRLPDGTYEFVQNEARTPVSVQAGTEVKEEFAPAKNSERIVYIPRYIDHSTNFEELRDETYVVKPLIHLPLRYGLIQLFGPKKISKRELSFYEAHGWFERPAANPDSDEKPFLLWPNQSPRRKRDKVSN